MRFGILEDDPADFKAITSALARLGINVRDFRSIGGPDDYVGGTYDGLIFDVVLDKIPGQDDGIVALKRIRATDPEVFIAIYTGFASDYKSEAKLWGANVILSKSGDWDRDMLQVLTAYLLNHNWNSTQLVTVKTLLEDLRQAHANQKNKLDALNNDLTALGFLSLSAVGYSISWGIFVWLAVRFEIRLPMLSTFGCIFAVTCISLYLWLLLVTRVGMLSTQVPAAKVFSHFLKFRKWIERKLLGGVVVEVVAEALAKRAFR